MLGFIMRMTQYFKDYKTLITLYKSLVRCSVEYGSRIWSPFYHNNIYKLEQIQIRFTRSFIINTTYQISMFHMKVDYLF